ncbi:PAS domain S-box protein [Halosimplex rubrum]|uniref:PAS domain S-box protein n=1 Tax=Halosimplex rubrum TaxID=869889 RepID=A0A7D5P2Y9_9EURY|nr:PAS domain S-box protein [Halosimplex rubrum]QLH79663.1 PAS domain S-box protein [Halosimplex rubrum]
MERLETELEHASVRAVPSPATLTDRTPGADACLVAVVDERALEIDDIERLTCHERPVVAFVTPSAGRADAALASGATDVVTAAGPDRFAVLSHRPETLGVDHASGGADRAPTAQFEALTNNDSFAVLTVDTESCVQYASPATEGIFGYPPAELEGESLTTIMPERFHESHHEGIAAYLASGERSLDWSWIELPGRHRDGTEIPLGISFGEHVTEDSHLFSAVVRDMRDRYDRESDPPSSPTPAGLGPVETVRHRDGRRGGRIRFERGDGGFDRSLERISTMGPSRIRPVGRSYHSRRPRTWSRREHFRSL